MLTLLFITLSLFSLADALCAQGRPQFHVSRAETPPKIDGNLGDAVWNKDALDLGQWISYNPIYGEAMTFRTEVRVSYDDRSLYFAFHCFDEEPEKIRTTISRRDSAFNDDWIGFSLDSNGTGQTAYHLFVNPSGVQMDALNTSSSGERFEADLVWDSAGRVTDDGYIVEIRLPLQSIRFQSGKDVRMGILFWRRVSRTGVSAAWPEIPPGQWVFNRHAQLAIEELEQPRLIEVLPSITYGIQQMRATPQSWKSANSTTDAGLSAKIGITSNITLDATINPDFSQVESDAFQVVVNQRFPVFYSEKRPFFMEGMGLFNIAGTGGDGNMRTGVHTRTIVNPSWGAKLTGTTGKLTFGLLSASDETPEDIGGRGAAVAGRNKLFTIGRATYGFKEADYVGAIVVDTEHAGRFNRVAGGDVSHRLTPRQQVSATLLSSQTAIAGEPRKHGTAAQVSYNFNDRKFLFLSQIEHYAKDFQMDTGFYNRTGFTAGWAYTAVNFYPKDTSKAWLKRAFPFFWTKQGRDRIQEGRDRFFLTGMRFNFTRQGFLSVQQGIGGREPWMARQFKAGGTNVFGSVQILRWLQLNGGANKGWSIYYDRVDPFQGKNRSLNVGITLQPSQRFNQNISVNTVRFNRAPNGEHIYTVNIVNLRTTYQFSRRFLVRAIEQFDSSRKRVLTDLLASYEFVPGTVFHAGYGSLTEKGSFENGSFVSGAGEYLTTSRGLFFKASYLHRF
jgi:hypothetical protein